MTTTAQHLLNGLIAGLAAGLTLAPPAQAAERLGAIPPVFRGLWMAEARHCTATQSDESWLRIEADRLSFYESSGPVLAVAGEGPERIGVIIALSGEGSTWLYLGLLSLDPGGDRLRLVSTGVEGEVLRVRCETR